MTRWPPTPPRTRAGRTEKLAADLAEIRAELQRVDTKAAALLAVAGVAFTICLTMLARTTLPATAAYAAWCAVAFLGAGVVLLALAIQPRIDGDHGWVRYARATTPEKLLDQPHALLAVLADQVFWTARTVRAKYQRIRYAVWLLLAGLAATVAVAAAAGLS